ncbi:MAG: LysM peptidoglycan-binding domain-containing protein [Candidatus Pacebacteria bacterium]|nr:LysM peptidoglycan-binding domain-containing protein [Candidatus Paceibacterota bacterium]
MLDYSCSKSLFDRLCRKIKGSQKTPCLCLGAISVFLFILVSLASGQLIKSLPNKGDFSLANVSKIFEEEKKDIFINQNQKIWSESPEFLLVEGTSLKASSPPSDFSPQVLGALVGGYEVEDTKKVVVEYIVEEGDTLWSLSSKFNISLNTILWANDLNKNSVLKLGQKLIILPVSGVIHHVKAGDTISDVAKTYKGKTEEIIAFNNLSSEGDVYVGDIVIIPNGVLPAPSTQQAPIWVPLADSYFICPVSSPCRITQGLHWYNAVDFSHGKCGDYIYAAAAGEVIKVYLTNSTSRWANGGAGNTISILHPNGVVTSYGHIAASLVTPGQQVYQGQIIALMGGQPGTPGAGLSTGCHVHFGVSGARNPFSR